MTDVVVRTLPELVQALRDRRDELGLTHETLDHISGLQSGYTSKVLAPIPIKGLGHVSAPALLGALAFEIAEIKLTVDPKQAEVLASRWTRGKRRPT